MVVLCHLHCFLFIFIVYLCKIEKCSKLRVNFSENTSFGVLSVDDFVGISETGLALQKIIDIVHNYSKYWCFEANAKSILL